MAGYYRRLLSRSICSESERPEGCDQGERQPDPNRKTDGDRHHGQSEGSRRQCARATQGGATKREARRCDERLPRRRESARASDMSFVAAQHLCSGDEQQSD